MWLPAWLLWLEGNVILKFFIYGLAFFTLGIVTLHEWRQERLSASPVGRSLYLLAAFAFLHAVVEWLQMFHLIHDHGLDILWGAWLPPARVGLLALSGLALGSFGCTLVVRARPSMRPLGAILLLLFAIWFTGFLLTLQQGLAAAASELRLTEVWARYLLYLPGSLLTAWGLTIQPAHPPSGEDSGAVNDYDTLAIVFLLNALVAGAIVPPAPFYPAAIINSDSFETAFGVPVQFARGAVVVAMSYYLSRILWQFELRRWLGIEKLNSRLRKLSAQVIAAQEEERKRVARDLHDDTAQALTALLLRLRALEHANLSDSDRRAMEELRCLTARTFENVRRLAAELRPADLDDLGLVSALEFHLKNYGQHYGIRATLHVDGIRRRLPADFELAVYRIVQEALTNAARHGSASYVTVLLEQTDSMARIAVSDDGKGFDVDAVMADKERGLGLFGMQERAALVGGTLQIDSRLGAGTTVIVEAPISKSKMQIEPRYGPLEVAHN